MVVAYYFALIGYTAVLRLLALLGHHKARRWVAGRKNWAASLATWATEDPRPTLWMHCASLGEFEQGRPLLEALRTRFPNYRVLLSFFSPSGYEPLRETPLAERVVYLPADVPGQAARFVVLVQPEAAFFVKYDLWYGYLTALERAGVATYLIAAAFRPEQPFFRWYGGFFRRLLCCFTQIFVQNEASLQLLEGIGYTAAQRAGDPRLDRVLDVRDQARAFPIVEQFAAGRPTLVAGSTWPADEALLAPLLDAQPDLVLVLAPHEIHEAHLAAIERTFAGHAVVRYTQRGEVEAPLTARVLVVDTMGMLRALYRYGAVAYIGGGLGEGLHNSLEAAVYGLPLVYGPNYRKFPEAVAFVQSGVATEIRDAETLHTAVQQARQPRTQAFAKATLDAYFECNRGATAHMIDALAPRLAAR